jgi:hypothetical protein
VTVARLIISSGFKNGRGTYGTGRLFRGVFLSDRPLDANEGANGDALLNVTLDLPESALAKCEWVEEGKGYREWCVPARVVNRRMSVELVDDQPWDKATTAEEFWALLRTA